MDGRAMAVEASIGRQITDDQLDAVKRAHVIEFGQTGRDGTFARGLNWTDIHIAEKREILRKAKFTNKEIDKLLSDGII